MSADDLKYQIGISLIPGIGNILAKKLIAYAGSIEGVFREKKRNLMKIPGIGEYLAGRIVSQDVLPRAEKEIGFIERYKIRTFFYLDENYPNRLKQCEDAPVVLFMKGEADLDATKIISVVGTRHATEYGKDLCERIIAALASRHPQLIVVSGLAYGIDVTAHKAALRNELPTLAVIAHGLQHLYPPEHKNIARQIVSHGALLTDFLSDEKPERNNFIKRNRLIAGLADGTLVVESGVEGGALITADLANSYNREVMALPGRSGDEHSAGCNALIKSNKAALIEDAADIEDLLGWDNNQEAKAMQGRLFPVLSAEEELLYDIIRTHGTIVIDEICEKSGFTMQKTSALLLNLEFADHIKSLPGKVYALRKA